jgi:hypothetical protein
MTGLDGYTPRITLDLAAPNPADLPPSVFTQARPIVPREEALERLVRQDPFFNLGDATPDLTPQQMVDMLPSNHPMRRQLEDAIERRRLLDIPVEPQPVEGRSLARQFSDYLDRQSGRDPLAGRTRDTRSPLDRRVGELDTLGSEISSARRNLTRAQDLAGQTTRPEGVTSSEWSATLRQRQVDVEAAQRQLDDLLDIQADPTRRTRITDQAIGEIDTELDRATARALEDPTVRSLYADRLTNDVRARLRAQRWGRRLRAGGYTLLGGLVAAGTATGAYLAGRGTEQRISAVDLARRAINGDISPNDTEALIVMLGEEEAFRLLDEADQIRRDGVDLDALDDEIEAEIDQDIEDGFLNPETGAEIEQLEMPDEGAGIAPPSEDRPASVFNPAPEDEAVLINADMPLEDEPPPETDGTLRYRGENPFQFLRENEPALVQAFTEMGLSPDEIVTMHEDLTQQYWREGLADLFPSAMERYFSGENMLGDNAVTRTLDRSLEAMREPLRDRIVDPPESGSILDRLINNPTTRMHDNFRRFLIPETSDSLIRDGIDFTGDLFTIGSQSEVITDAFNAIGEDIWNIRDHFRDDLPGLGPIARELSADQGASYALLPADAPLIGALPPEGMGSGGRPGTDPNVYNAPETFGDLLFAEQSGMLPFPGNAIENADRLGIDVPMQFRNRPGQPSIIDDTPALGPAPDVEERADLQFEDDDIDRVVNDLIQQDEFAHPRGQFEDTPRGLEDDPFIVEPFSQPNPELMAGGGLDRPVFGVGLANASTADMLGGGTVLTPEDQTALGGVPSLPVPADDYGTTFDPVPDPASYIPRANSEVAAPTGRGAPTPTLTYGNIDEAGAVPDGAIGDFRGSQTGDPAGLAEDAEAAERELNGINRWLEARGFDEEERHALSLGLIRMGATMMSTPGSFGEALGAGLNAGLDTYTGQLSEAEAEEMARMEMDMDQQRQQAELSILQSREARERLAARMATEAPSFGSDLEAYEYFLAKIEESPIYDGLPDEERRDLARAAAGMRGAPSPDLLAQLLAAQ